jgi:arsenate reductase (thioredoxin)
MTTRPASRCTRSRNADRMPNRILFVCIENSNRSQMAEAFARIHGSGRVEAHSAGSRPSGRINPRAIEFMKERGYDLSQHQSKSLSEIPIIEYDAVVTMGCGDACPFVRARRREDWNIRDPKELPAEEFRAVRDEIERKVIDLLMTW